MQERFRQYIEAVWSSVRVADAVDVIVVAVIVYFGVIWFRRSRSRLVMSGLGTLALLYFAAGLLEMHLTLALFKAGLTVAVVALVVIFQNEIRRAFERVALASRIRTESAAATLDATVDTVVEAAASFANSKTGALIVFKGREPLERHLKRGVPLNGQVSEPLLHSIFDASSAGHDGALIIENGIATRFAAHLPLAAEAPSDERTGTRHSAALGLSERCDALVVVVSEERGVISVAEDGRLETMSSSTELKKRIARFKARVSPEGAGRATPLLTQNLGAKVLSLALALAAWLVTFNYRNELVTRSVKASILFENVPDESIVREPVPASVLLTVSGPKGKLEGIESEGVDLLIDVGRSREGINRHVVTDSDIALPKGVQVRDVQPSAVKFTVERIVQVTASVQPKTAGRLRRGLWLQKISVNPPRVKLSVPRSRASLGQVTTEAVPLDEIERTSELRRELQLPKGVELAEGQPNSVTVQVAVGGAGP